MNQKQKTKVCRYRLVTRTFLGAVAMILGVGLAPAHGHADAPSFSIAGSINASTNGDEVFVNLGGPNLKLKVQDVAFGLSFYPSLKLRPGTVGAALGAGPYVGYKWIQVVMPFYMIDGKMRPTFGLGYVF